jgi:YidC/Oxa1 family membrane protein insertase
MDEEEDELTVDLYWSHDGIHVTKRFIFRRGSYQVEVQHLVQNRSGSSWSGREYRQLLRSPIGEDGTSRFLYTYTGGAIYSPEEKYEKISFDDMEEKKLSLDVSSGWVAMLQHYFIGAWVPTPAEKNHFYSNVLSGERYQIGAYSPLVNVASGSNHQFSSSLVVGPKLQDRLREIAPGLDLTVDYGWLTILAQPIFWLLNKLHSLIGNWGWAIIALTILIKLAFYRLSASSYRSMAHMRKMTPRMQALKERYGDDKQQLNQAMMDLYKKEKINPLGGCLPIVVQIPVFIALYWVLMEAVELRQAPFIFWINDLSIKDPFYVLPLIMGVSMFIQQKLNPAPPDPMQAKIMMSLPFVFTVFFAFFPAGLVLYWVTNNILSIAQQWYITRQIERATSHD